MTTANTTFAIDPLIKKKVLVRAKKDQLSISAIIRIFLNDYAEGKLRIGAQPVFTENGFTSEQEAVILRRLNESEKEKNLSPEFSNMKEAISYLESKTE